MDNGLLDLGALQIMVPVRNEPESQGPWTPISATNWEIRILGLLLGGSNDPIECQTRSVLLADIPRYEAVSYVWGSHNALKSVKISGFEVITSHDERVHHIATVPKP